MNRLRIFFPVFLAFVFALLLPGEAIAAPILKQGSEGHDVQVLQQNLQSLGYEVEPDGVFGYTTYRAVIAFQRDEKISISGQVDRETWRILKQRASEKKPKPNPKEPLQGKKTDAPPKEDSPKNIPAAAKVPESAPFLPKNKVSPIIKAAKKFIGTRYVFGGTTPKGFDCSGFVQYVFKKNGFTIPLLLHV